MLPLYSGILVELVLGVQNQLQMSYSPFSEGWLVQEMCLLLEQLSGFHCSSLLVLAGFMFTSLFFYYFFFPQNVSETFDTFFTVLLGCFVRAIMLLQCWNFFSLRVPSPPNNFTNFSALGFSALFGFFAVSYHFLSRQTVPASWYKGSSVLFGIS